MSCHCFTARLKVGTYKVSIVSPLEGKVQLMTERIFIVISAALRSGVNSLVLRPEVVWLLNLLCVFSRGILQVLDGRLPVDVGSNRVHECNCIALSDTALER